MGEAPNDLERGTCSKCCAKLNLLRRVAHHPERVAILPCHNLKHGKRCSSCANGLPASPNAFGIARRLLDVRTSVGNQRDKGVKRHCDLGAREYSNVDMAGHERHGLTDEWSTQDLAFKVLGRLVIIPNRQSDPSRNQRRSRHRSLTES